MAFHQVQAQPFALAGAGAVAGATSIILKSFAQIDGSLLTITNFGAIGYLTLEPGNGTLEEQVSFSGVTQNANGTATLTGIKTVLDISPYTETSGLAQTHAGSTTVVLSNTAGFYNQFPAKQNDETVTGQWTFTNTPIVPGTVSDASTTVKGVSKTSVAPASAANPIVVGTNDPRIEALFYGVSAVGSDAYAITLTEANAPVAYAAGQVFTFKADVANTGPATLAVNALAAKTIKKYTSTDLVTGDILANQLVTVQYDGTNFQIVSYPSTFSPTVLATYVSSNGVATKNLADASTSQVIAHGLGIIPSLVRINSVYVSTTVSSETTGAFKSGNQSCVYMGLNSAGNGVTGSSTSAAVVLIEGTTTANNQTGVVSVDATNITITWTKSGSGSGSATFLWSAEGFTTLT